MQYNPIQMTLKEKHKIRLMIKDLKILTNNGRGQDDLMDFISRFENFITLLEKLIK